MKYAISAVIMATVLLLEFGCKASSERNRYFAEATRTLNLVEKSKRDFDLESQVLQKALDSAGDKGGYCELVNALGGRMKHSLDSMKFEWQKHVALKGCERSYGLIDTAIENQSLRVYCLAGYLSLSARGSLDDSYTFTVECVNQLAENVISEARKALAQEQNQENKSWK